MVGEFLILLRIQSLQKSRRGISPEIITDFIYLIQHKHRVFGTGILNPLNNPAR